jgi:NTE family protein
MPRDIRSGRALVLGGGGVAGIAWETGLIAGLARAGVDLTQADLIVGTSAGASVAAQITSGTSMKELYSRQLDADADIEPQIDVDTSALLDDFASIFASESEPVRIRQRLGHLSLEADRVSEAARRKIIERRLPNHSWPATPLMRLAAIDALSGEFVTFDRTSGVPLVDAVAASCAVPRIWPAMTINGRRYIDGGLRSTTNVDLARGYDRVFVLEAGRSNATVDVEPLDHRSRGLTVVPNEESVIAQGGDAMDPTVRPATAEAGYRQGLAAIEEIRSFWI